MIDDDNVIFGHSVFYVLYKGEDKMSKKLGMKKKRIIFMRHGSSSLSNNNGYGKLSYDEFTKLLSHDVNPPLSNSNGHFDPAAFVRKIAYYIIVPSHKIKIYNKLYRYKIKKVPPKPDIIYHSTSRRAIQTANLINEFYKYQIKIDNSLKDHLSEVIFSEDIITEETYKKKGGLLGCRNILIEKWFNDENQAESFSDSLKRLAELDRILRQNKFENILLITHGWYLRLIYLFYERKIIKDRKKTFEHLKKAPKLKYGKTLKYDIDIEGEPLNEWNSYVNQILQYYSSSTKQESILSEINE